MWMKVKSAYDPKHNQKQNDITTRQDKKLRQNRAVPYLPCQITPKNLWNIDGIKHSFDIGSYLKWSPYEIIQKISG